MLENSEVQAPNTQIPQTQPQQAESPLTGIKPRLTDIVNCLIEYKQKFINRSTLKSGDPADLNNIVPLLKERCNIIKAFMTPPRIRPPRLNSEDADDFEDCLDCLTIALKPWDSDLSILCPEFCDKIFEGFNQNSKKILDEIDLYCPVDGSDEI